ncbi:MAG: hypothetical protein ACD_79C00412G0001 [uncultured bacterium]|nr:MAG: hypothetical protein ACD_79C00412G0001 [uncultured bacterium]
MKTSLYQYKFPYNINFDLYYKNKTNELVNLITIYQKIGNFFKVQQLENELFSVVKCKLELKKRELK